MKMLSRLALILPLISGFFSSAALADEPPCPFYENRSALCGYYKAEISPAAAFIDTVVKRGSWSNPQLRPVILDVRSTSEYKAGHPEHSFNVPYPYIYQYCIGARLPDGACSAKSAQINQDPAFFVEYVKKLVPNKDTPIYTLCRTGVRSVGAANVLADAGYTNVHNIWEGFVGVNLTAPKVQADGSKLTLPVDLNHDGVLNDLDKNGWRNHQRLPYDTRLLPSLIYLPAIETYKWE